MKLFIIGLLLTNICFASVLKREGDSYKVLKQDFTIDALVQDYAKLKGYTLIVDKRINDQMSVFGPKIINASDLGVFVTSLLSDAGYTMLATDDIKQLEIISARDIRYRGGKVLKDITKVPEDYNFYQFVMKLKYVESHDTTRNLRPFITRYGRVIDEKNANTIILADTGKNIHRIHDLIKKLDTSDFLVRQKKVQTINATAKKELKRSKSILGYIKDQHVLFLIAFALIGGIIGFGTRGYLMKRIEGGW